MTILIDSYTVFANTSGVGAGHYFGQSFDNTLGQSSILNSCKWNIRYTISPITGFAVAYLYTHNGIYGISSVPTGLPLAISNFLDLSNVTSTITFYTFNFSGVNAILIPNQYYCIVIKLVSISGGNLALGAKNISPTHSGNKFESLNGGISWTPSSGQDLNFYIYGEDISTTLTAIELAESSLLQVDITSAQTLVTAVVDSSAKDTLQARLQVVKETLRLQIYNALPSSQPAKTRGNGTSTSVAFNNLIDEKKGRHR